MKHAETDVEYEVVWKVIYARDAYDHGNRFHRRSEKASTITGVQEIITHAIREEGLYDQPTRAGDFHIVKRVISKMELSEEEKKALGL